MSSFFQWLQHPMVAISLGGAIGCNIRYGVGRLFSTWFAANAHWGTFLVNLVGAAILGVVACSFSNRGHWFYMMLAVGFCGGLTTFSTFSMEVVEMVRDKKLGLALAYVLISNLVGFIAFASAYAIAEIWSQRSI